MHPTSEPNPSAPQPNEEPATTAVAPEPAPFRLVDHAEALAPLMEAVREHPRVALDTEADSLHHYREKVCLIQLTVNGGHWLVDPLAEGLDLEPLMRLLEDRDLVLHGADYDLRLLFRTFEFRPQRLFDTMLGAQLLGWSEFGLAALAQRVLGLALSKHGQRADWSVRPIPDDLRSYAVDDTRFLLRIADAIEGGLRALGRLDWLAESCERQLEITRRDPDEAQPDREPWRIKGGRHLRGRAAAMLHALWHWRDEIARRLDRPAFRVAPNALLLEWATWADENPDAGAEQTPERPAWLRGSRLAGFEEAVERVLAMGPADYPKAPPKPRRGVRFLPEEEELLKRLLRARDEVAAGLGLHPGVLGPRDSILPLVRPRPTTEEAVRELGGMMRWQAACLAPALLPLLEAYPDTPAEG